MPGRFFRNRLRDVFKCRKCRLNGGHEYEMYRESFIEAGMGKMREYRCKKCGHERVEVI